MKKDYDEFERDIEDALYHTCPDDDDDEDILTTLDVIKGLALAFGVGVFFMVGTIVGYVLVRVIADFIHYRGIF